MRGDSSARHNVTLGIHNGNGLGWEFTQKGNPLSLSAAAPSPRLLPTFLQITHTKLLLLFWMGPFDPNYHYLL